MWRVRAPWRGEARKREARKREARRTNVDPGISAFDSAVKVSITGEKKRLICGGENKKMRSYWRGVRTASYDLGKLLNLHKCYDSGIKGTGEMAREEE